MHALLTQLSQHLQKHLYDKLISHHLYTDELTLEVPVRSWLDVANFLRYDDQTQFSQLIDLCAIDYSLYGQSDWNGGLNPSTISSQAKQPQALQATTQAVVDATNGRRFAVVIHLLSLQHNLRMRVRTFCEDNQYPVLPSLVRIWASAAWYEREAFDLYGILFNYHPDLRRLLTDYGFVGHPLRKDFAVSGEIELRYDALAQRVLQQPVSLKESVSIPRVISQSLGQLESGA